MAHADLSLKVAIAYASLIIFSLILCNLSTTARYNTIVWAHPNEFEEIVSRRSVKNT